MIIVDELVSWGLNLMAQGAAKKPQLSELEANWSSMNRKSARPGSAWAHTQKQSVQTGTVVLSLFFSFMNWAAFVQPPLTG